MHSELVEESHASTAGDTGAINCAPPWEHQIALCPKVKCSRGGQHVAHPDLSYD